MNPIKKGVTPWRRADPAARQLLEGGLLLICAWRRYRT